MMAQAHLCCNICAVIKAKVDRIKSWRDQNEFLLFIYFGPGSVYLYDDLFKPSMCKFKTQLDYNNNYQSNNTLM